MAIRQPLGRPTKLHFRAGGGRPLVATAVSLSPTAADYRLTIDVSRATYKRIVSELAFNLTEAAREPQSSGFRPADVVRIELAPDGSVIDALLAFGDEAEVVASMLATTDGELAESANWFALSVLSVVQLDDDWEGTLRAGYRTAWSSDGIGRRSTDLQAIARSLARTGRTAFDLDDAPGIAWLEVDGAITWRMTALSDDLGRVAVFSSLPIRAEPDQLVEVALVIAHLNAGVIVGNWEVEVLTGEILVKTSIDHGDDPVTPACTSGLIGWNRRLFLDGCRIVEGVLKGTTTVERAIAAAGEQRA